MSEPKNHRNHPWRLTLLAGLLAAQFAVAQPTTPVSIDIPAQPLAAALAKFAEQSGVKTLYAAELLAGKTAPRVQGQLSPAAALQQLLAGSGLRFRAVGNDAVAIEAIPADAETATTLRPVRVGAGSLAESSGTYAEPVARTATKTDTPLLETPASISVVPQKVLQDQKTTTLNQALSNVSGVVTTGKDDLQEGVTIRGFFTTQTLRDGVLVSEYSTTGGGTVGAVNMTNVQSVEVLKGPAAILYGRMEPGGIVNIVKKKPLEQFNGSLEQQVGSWDHYRTSLDLSGPVDATKTLLYRLNASYDQSNFWRNDVGSKTYFIAPVLEWRVAPRTTVWFEGEYGHQKIRQDIQVVPIDPDTNKIDASFPRNVNFLQSEPATFNTSWTALKWEHKFNDDWSVKQQFIHNQTIGPGSITVFPYGLDDQGNFGMFRSNGVWFDVRTSSYAATSMKSDATVLDVTGHLETGGIKHTLLFGADHSRSKFKFNFSEFPNPNFDVTPAANPTYPNIPVNLATIAPSDFGAMRAWGMYLQDQVKLSSEVTALAGLRSQFFATQGIDGGSDQFDHALTPRLGMVWQFRPAFSVYGSYTGGFGSNNGFDWQGKPLSPESARQYELGAKAEFFGGKLTGSVALFDLTKTNVAIADLLHPNGAGGFFSKTGGAINSRGVEIDLQGEVAPGWDVLANYSFVRAIVTASAPNSNLVEGNRQANAPEHVVNLWGTHRFRQAVLQGWKVGAGFNWHGSSLDQSNVYTNPAFIVWNAMASYDFRLSQQKVTAQLNINNVFNRKYYDYINYPSGSYTFVTYGNPRSATASLKVDF